MFWCENHIYNQFERDQYFKLFFNPNVVQDFARRSRRHNTKCQTGVLISSAC